MPLTSTRVHIAGFAVVLGTAGLLLIGLLLIEPSLGARIIERGEPLYFLTVALVPVAVWLVPPFVRALTRATYRTHRGLAAKGGGAYVRVPEARVIRFRDTALMAVGPFSIDLFVIAEIEYLAGGGTQDPRFRLVAFPLLFLLAGALTSLAPGAWLLDALEMRLISPQRGEVIRAAELFERILGPTGAAALLASFVTLLHTENYSYERALFSLGLWAVRLFPPVLGAVCVYRLVVEPRVLPALEAWCESEGIERRDALPDVLTEWAGSNAASLK